MRYRQPQEIEEFTPYKGYVLERNTDQSVALVKYTQLRRGSTQLKSEEIEVFYRDEIDIVDLSGFYAMIRKEYTKGKPVVIRKSFYSVIYCY